MFVLLFVLLLQTLKGFAFVVFFNPKQVRGEMGPVERSGRALCRMYLVRVNDQETSSVDFADLLQTLRALGDKNKDLYFSKSLTETSGRKRGAFVSERQDERFEAERDVDRNRREESRSNTRNKKRSPRNRKKNREEKQQAKAPSPELTLDSYLAGLDDEDDDDESYS